MGQQAIYKPSKLLRATCMDTTDHLRRELKRPMIRREIRWGKMRALTRKIKRDKDSFIGWQDHLRATFAKAIDASINSTLRAPLCRKHYEEEQSNG